MDNINVMIPDIVGFTLADARKVLDEADIEIEKIIVTAPPRCTDREYNDSFRVIRQKKISKQKVELLVCSASKK